jgi:hypothetical protein
MVDSDLDDIRKLPKIGPYLDNLNSVVVELNDINKALLGPNFESEDINQIKGKLKNITRILASPSFEPLFKLKQYRDEGRRLVQLGSKSRELPGIASSKHTLASPQSPRFWNEQLTQSQSVRLPEITLSPAAAGGISIFAP